MRRRILLSAGLVPLLLGSVRPLNHPEYLEDRLVQRVSPDLDDIHTLSLQGASAGGRKPKLSVQKSSQSETKFSRDSVEAAPDTIEPPSFTAARVQTYSQDEEPTTFNRQFVEAGSLKAYGAASPIQPFNSELRVGGGLEGFGAAASLFRGADQGSLYYGAGNPNYSPYSPYGPYFDSSLPMAYSLGGAAGRRAGAPTGEVAHPLREAVEKRPLNNNPKVYRGPDQNLASLRSKYQRENLNSFKQARPNPKYKVANHDEKLKETIQSKSGSKEYKIVCYYGAWSVYRKSPFNFGVSDIDPFSCTHLIYSFAGLDPTELTITSLDQEEDLVKGSYKSAIGLKAINPGLKVMIAIGGWNEGGKKYSSMVETVAGRQKFIKSVVALLEAHGFDGLDLDWEYPGADDRDGQWSDRDNFSALVEELAAQFQPRGWILSAAVSPARFRVDEGYDVKRIAQHMDFINVMTYDLHGDWDNFADHHAPLHAREHDSWEFKSLNTEAGIAYWRSKGAPLEKLLLGTPFYGRSFTLSSANSTQPGAKSRGPGKAGEFTEEPGFLAYYEICRMIADGGWAEKADSDGNAYIVKGDQWIGYDKVENIKRKMNFVRSNGLGGAMVWAIDLDDYKGTCGTKWPLLTNMNLILRPEGGLVPDVVDQNDRRPPGFGLFNPEDSGVIAAVEAEEDGEGGLQGDLDNYICTSAGTFHSSTSCSKYYTCSPDGTVFTFTCPEGLFYDPAFGICNWPEAVSCASVPNPTLYRDKICDKLGDGLFSDPHSSNQFFHCISRQRVQLACGLGLHFDSVTGHCGQPYSARFVPGAIVRVGPPTSATGLQRYTTGGDKRVMCYFTNWSGMRDADAKFVPEQIPAAKCSHVIYAFAKLDEEKFTPVPSGPIADIDDDYFNRVQRTVKSGNPNAKVLIAVGGWADSTGDKYSKLVNSPDLREKFVQGALAFMKAHQFDGMVLEWHFPVCWQSDCTKGPASDRTGFTQLVSQLRRAFGSQYELGATLSGYQKVVDRAYDVAELNADLDFLNIMSYDLHGFWDEETQNHAPMQGPISVASVLNHYVSKGADKSKIIMGIPFYGQSFQLDGSETGYGSPTRGPGSAGSSTKQPGMLGFHEICQNVKKGWVQSLGDLSKGPYAYDVASKQWVGFDSMESARLKAEYVLAEGYGGVSVSTLDLDDFNNLCCQGAHPLLSSISQVLLHLPPTPVSCTRPSAPTTPPPRPSTTNDPYDDGSKKQWTEETTYRTTTAGYTTPSTTPPTPANQGECTNGDYMKSPTHCNQYYRCINGSKELHSCSEGLSWDSVNLRCDWPDKVNCHSRAVFNEQGNAIIAGLIDSPVQELEAVSPGVESGCLPGISYAQVPGDCSSFFQCVNSVAIKVSCSPGLHFSPQKGLCDWPASAGCKSYLVADRTTTCQEGSYQPDPADCAAYHFCVHGEYMRFSCQGGTHWDRNLLVCNHAALAGCTTGTAGTGALQPTTEKDDDSNNSWDNGGSNWDNGGNSWDNSGNNWDNGNGDNGQWTPSTPKPTTPRPSGPTEPVPLQGPLSGDFKVVCYFTNWAWYRPGIGKYRPEDIDPTICTHIVYGFAVLDYTTLLLKPHDSWADLDNDFYGKVTEYKKYGIKVSLAIGGWNDSEGDKYSRLVNNPGARAKFIANVVQFIEKYNFDGLDLDWEYPSCWQTECKEERYSDKEAFSAWVHELKAAFRPRGLLLSAAVSPSKKIIDVGYNVPSIAADLDWIAVMTYDYHGHWDKKTGHVAPFYAHPEDEFFYFNTNYTINYWIESGAPASKLVMGMPMYGQAFTLDNPQQNGLNAPAGEKGQAGEYTRASGFLAYYEICQGLKRGGWTVIKDPQGRIGPYAYKDRQWVGYDDVDTIRRKSEFVRKMGLGGGMVWALDLDDFRNECGEGPHPLMNTIKEVLGPVRGNYAPTKEFEKGVLVADQVRKPADTVADNIALLDKLVQDPKIPTKDSGAVSQSSSTDEYKVVCYYTNWSSYRPGTGKFVPENIDSSLCTHIVYGFAILDTTSLLIRAHDSWLDLGSGGGTGLEYYKKVTSLKTNNRKVLLALGGWNDSEGNKYSTLVNSPTNRKKFIEHAVAFLKKHNFDGLDLDWEYPVCWQVDCKRGPQSDKESFSAWIQELSAAFRAEGLLVTAAVSPSNKVMDEAYDIPKLSRYLDYVSVMTYDYHGQWDKQTGHVAPMYQHPEDENIFFNVNFTVNYWINGGLDSRKLILGMPTYGQSFTLTSASKNGLNSKTYGGATAGPFTRQKGFLAYYEICDNIQNKGWKVIQDPTGNMGPYAYKGDQWVSFDDAAMIKHKSEYIKKMNLGGAMIWALDLDDFGNTCGCEQYPLLKTINRVLKGQAGSQTCALKGNYRIGALELSPSPYTDCSKGNLAAVEGDCSSFSVCNNGEYLVQQCPTGLHWNRDHCDWPENSACVSTGGVVSPPPAPVQAVDTGVAAKPVPQESGSVANTGMKVVCYYTNWAWYRQGIGKYSPESINPTLCTHINYGFAVLDTNRLIMVPHDSWSDIDNHHFEKVAALKKQGVTVSVALGGWNDSEGDKYSRLVNSPTARKTFVTEAVKFVEKWGFQGLDLDWEYPRCWQVDCDLGPASDKDGFSALVRELSAEFRPRGWSLSAAVSPSKAVIDAGYDVPVLNQYLDIINVMTYDYHGHWDKKTGHVAPFLEHPEDENKFFNANFTMNYWASQGASKSKLVLGMPMYGQSFSLADKTNNGLNAASYGRGEAGEFTRAGGFLAYYEICEKVKSAGWNIVRDPLNRIGPYAYKGDQWVGYDDISMIRLKSQFVKDNGFGGGMIWALDLDDFANRCGCETYPLLKTINRVLRGYSSPDPQCDARYLPYMLPQAPQYNIPIYPQFYFGTYL